MHENSAQIILKDIEKAYGSRKIMDGINMEICPGDFICIYGKSERLRRYKIAYLFQNFALVEKNDREIDKNQFIDCRLNSDFLLIPTVVLSYRGFRKGPM